MHYGVVRAAERRRGSGGIRPGSDKRSSGPSPPPLRSKLFRFTRPPGIRAPYPHHHQTAHGSCQQGIRRSEEPSTEEQRQMAFYLFSSEMNLRCNLSAAKNILFVGRDFPGVTATSLLFALQLRDEYLFAQD